MDAQTIKTAKSLNLKPNDYLRDPQTPFLYQRRGALMMVLRPRMVLGDDVGLGKTLESLVAYTYLKAARPETKALVLTEKLAFVQWQQEIKKFTQGLSAKIITTGTYEDPAARVRAFRQHGADIVITGYSSIYNYSQYLLEGLGPRWVLIADEPNYFKNDDTLLYKNMRGMTLGDLQGKPYRVVREKDAEGKNEDKLVPVEKGATAIRSYGLTATVIENRLEEAYGVFSIVAHGCFQSKSQFEKDYCVKKKVRGKHVWTTIGYKNLDVFRSQIEPYYFGRLQDDPEVEQELPEVIPKDLEITLSKEQSAKVLEAMDRIIEMPSGEIKQIQVLQSTTIAQQLTDDPRVMGYKIASEKTAALIETLTNSLKGERVLIFSKFRRVIDLLEEELRKSGLESVRITGKESDLEREHAKTRFMSDGSDHCPIILGTRAIMKAINLQKGGHLFMFDVPWSYGWYRQLVGRLKRTGSTQKRIGVYRMIGRLHPDIAARLGSDRTIDHYSLDVLLKKFKLWQAITQDAIEIESTTSDVSDIFNAIRQGHRKAA